jgi:hypothetical protein
MKQILRRSYRPPHRGGATGRVLSKLQNLCRWTLQSDMPWWSSFFSHPLTYLSTLYVSTIVLLVSVPTYVKPTCRQPTKMTQHCRGPKWDDVAKCRPDIWQHVADMSADTTFGPQNCRHRHRHAQLRRADDGH